MGNNIFSDGFCFAILVIFIVILVSVQFTLNMILRELREIRKKIGYNMYDNNTKVKNNE